MRKGIKYALLALLIFSGCKQIDRAGKSGPLFLIFENNKYGYINSKGYVVIPPIYFAADNFSEGLAPVRPDGSYGYIDTTGQLVIPSQFDYATPFSDGVALVYNNGTAFYIDKTGKRLFQHTFAEMEPFQDGKAFVRTTSYKRGIINKQGKLLIDTLYHNLTPTRYGYTIVNNTDNDEYGIIDAAGRFVVPLGLYSYIESPTDGYYKVSFRRGDEKFTGFIDNAFHLRLFRKDTGSISGIEGGMHNRWAPITRFQPENMSDCYMDYINPDGNTLLNDSTVVHTYPFSDNRAFVKYPDDNYYLIDTKGKKVSSKAYSHIDEDLGFKGGVACVGVNGWGGVIDTNAHFIIKPEFTQIQRLDMAGNYFLFNDDFRNGGPLGIIGRTGHVVLPRVLQKYDTRGFVNGLLNCIIQDRPAYIDRTGYIVWRAPMASSLYDLNTDMMMPSAYWAFDSTERRLKLSGGKTLPITIRNANHFPAGKLSVIAATDLKDTFCQKYNGFNVFVANHKDQPIDFNTTGQGLHMKVQALTQNKKWQDVEYISRNCVRDRLRLGAHQYWRFVCPVYHGTFKTKLRIELKYLATTSDYKEVTIYSNEFDGGINPGQLWRKPIYAANNIMDPYLN